VKTRIDHLHIKTKNMSESIYFYCEIFGMKIHGQDNRLSTEGYSAVYMHFPDAEFKLELVYETSENPGKYVLGTVVGHIGIYTDSLDEIVKKAKSRGYEFRHIFNHKKGEDKEYNIGLLDSPEGVELSVIEALHYGK
jgi:catechol 2,3-dioxygenase-like lactoylglutathione lyase family enzyme